MVRRNVLMSIRPQYAEAILSGSKLYELRRRRPSFGAGSRVIVYSSSPDQRLLGTFEAGTILAANPETLWGLVHGQAGIDRSAFAAYFAGCDIAYARFCRHGGWTQRRSGFARRSPTCSCGVVDAVTNAYCVGRALPRSGSWSPSRRATPRCPGALPVPGWSRP